MPRQIQKIKQTQKIIKTHQKHTRAQTQKNYTNPKIKHKKKKNHKRILYKTKSIHIYTQAKLSKIKNRFKFEN